MAHIDDTQSKIEDNTTFGMHVFVSRLSAWAPRQRAIFGEGMYNSHQERVLGNTMEILAPISSACLAMTSSPAETSASHSV